MLHDEDAVGQHSKHSLPFFLFYFAFVEEAETVAQVNFVHPNEAGREYDCCRDVHIEIGANAIVVVIQVNQYYVNQKAQTINGHHRIPLH